MSDSGSEADPSDDLKSSLSLEEMLQLRDKLNRKTYSELVFGPSDDPKKEKKRDKGSFKRDNHHRPREESSKVPPKGVLEVFVVKKEQKIKRVDPRFEETAGKFDEKIFKTRYSFLDEIKQKEREDLQKEFNKEQDPERRAEIASLIQRYDNKMRAEKAKKDKEEITKRLKQAKREKLGVNKKQIYLSKSEIKKAELVEKFKELKKSSKLAKYLERKRKRNAARERIKVFSN